MTDYVALADLKAQLAITDTDRDDILTMAIAAASRQVDNITGRRFDIDATVTARTFAPAGRVLDHPDGHRMLLRADIGTLTGLIVEVGSGTSWTAVTTEVEAEPISAIVEGRPVTSLLYVGGRWTVGGGQRVRVTAKWGWPAVPDVVVQAATIQATRLYKRKDSPEGVLGSAEWGAVRLSRVDPDVQALLAPLVVPWVA